MNFNIHLFWKSKNRAPKVPFSFHFKIGMKKEIFMYFNFDSKLKIEAWLKLIGAPKVLFNFHFKIGMEKESVGRKGHSIFVLKWNRNLSFFRFSFSLSNWKTNFKSQFWFSIKIEKWISVRFFTKFFLCPNTPLISHTQILIFV